VRALPQVQASTAEIWPYSLCPVEPKRTQTHSWTAIVGRN
jgi:hypothetical protein